MTKGSFGVSRGLVGLLFAGAFCFLPLTSTGDIYRRLSSEGTDSFTDTPVEDRILLIIREAEKSEQTPSPVGPSGTPRQRKGRGDSARRAAAREARLPVGGIITSVAGWRNDPIDGLLRNHQGVDIAVPEGTPVKALSDGTVLFSGTRTGYGNVVVVGHREGVVTLYAHHALNLVSAGQRVTGEDTLALSGSTGRSTGPHLHFEVWRDGVNVTEPYLAKGTLFGAPSFASSHGEDELIRRIILADGSVLFTNMGAAQP